MLSQSFENSSDINRQEDYHYGLMKYIAELFGGSVFTNTDDSSITMVNMILPLDEETTFQMVNLNTIRHGQDDPCGTNKYFDKDFTPAIQLKTKLK